MKALQKQLIAAVAMVLVAVVALSSSTYAWFSMNTTVNATGMQVSAKSDNTFLLIGGSAESTATLIQAQTGDDLITEDLTISAAESKVYPSAPALTDPEVAYLTIANGHFDTANNLIATAGEKVIDSTTAVLPKNWYTANAAAADASTIKADSAKQLAAFTGYVIQKTVYLTVAVGSNGAKDLTVTPTFAVNDSGDDLTAAKAVIVTSDGGYTILSSGQNNTAVDIKGTNTPLTSTTALRVDIYIFYDGNDTNVYTINSADLKGVTLDLKFDVAAVPAT